MPNPTGFDLDQTNSLRATGIHGDIAYDDFDLLGQIFALDPTTHQ